MFDPKRFITAIATGGASEAATIEKLGKAASDVGKFVVEKRRVIEEAMATGGASEAIRAAPISDNAKEAISAAMTPGVIGFAGTAAVSAATEAIANALGIPGPRLVQNLLQDLINSNIPAPLGDFSPDLTQFIDIPQYFAAHPDITPSYVSLRLNIPIGLLQDAINQINLNFGVDEYNESFQGGADKGGLSYGYHVEGDSIKVTGEPNGCVIRANVELRYSFAARTKQAGILIPVSVGKENEGLRRVEAIMRVKPTINSNWGLDVQARAQLNPHDRALISIFGVDVTDFMCALISNYIGPKIEETSREQVQGFLDMDQVQNVFKWQTIGENLHLFINPVAAFYTALSTTRTMISLDIRLLCKPQLSLSMEIPSVVPSATNNRPPLLRVAEGAIDDTFSLQTTMHVNLITATQLIKREFNLDSQDNLSPMIINVPPGIDVSVTNVEVRYEQNRTATVSPARLVIGIKANVGQPFSQTVNLRLTGVPHLSSAETSHSISFPDLEFEAVTNGIVTNMGIALAANAIRDIFRQVIVIDLNAPLVELKEKINEALVDKRISPYAILRGNLATIKSWWNSKELCALTFRKYHNENLFCWHINQVSHSRK
jgi:hypothetical protein